ncbi:YaiI/YqxD family protein [Desulfomicrobium escambiense]|uniref:YaiI/YqxD family protein n=1 Tax=Desulfomicrobium escambiense TaxID=29503 RepID=UPI001FE12FD3|nr:YaiI/YqxD family protein [Desulfomicrobium escambiense]
MSDAPAMRIWVDADACPRVVKDILYRAADKRGVSLVLVANSRFAVPKSERIEFLQVGSGFDKADEAIIHLAGDGDLVVTTDIPLAAGVIEKGGTGLSPRGEVFTAENIRGRLTMRDFMDELRGSGVMTGGPSALRPKDRQEFSNQLDRLLRARGY